MASADPIIQSYLTFIEKSPTAWHAVAEASSVLESQGFKPLKEKERWELEAGGRYFVQRNGSALCAFVLPKRSPKALCLIGAHTDSPGLKLKPNSEYEQNGMTMLGVEVYGGPLLNSWLNRDLGISGTVHYIDASDRQQHALIHYTESPVVVPQLAIHLDRKVSSEGLKLNQQKHLAALAGCSGSGKKTGLGFIENAIRSQIDYKELLSSDLFLTPLEKPRLMGDQHALISSFRIDNLSGVHAGLTALMESIEPSEDTMKMVIFWDHEEVGSQTAQGAASPFLTDTIERISLALQMDREAYLRLLSQSFCLSVDSAHAVHPNYADRHEPNHQPLLGQGVVVKVNAQQRYASNAQTIARVEMVARQQGLSLQYFVSRTDMPCGSTIGPISATRSGIPTVDIGVPQLSMHSARELAASQDHEDMCKLLQALLESH